MLQFVAELHPDARLLPDSPWDRARVRQWLGFVGTELHKAIFVPLLDATASEEVKAYARSKVESRLGYLDRHLAGRPIDSGTPR